MSDPQPEREHPDAESMFDFLDDEKAQDGERATGRRTPASPQGLRRTMPIIRKPVPVSESGPIRPPGQERREGAGADEFDFLQRQSDEGQANAEPGGTINPFEDVLRPDGGYKRQFAEEAPVADGSQFRRSLGLFALLLVACGAVMYVYDYWPSLDGWNTGTAASVSSTGVGAVTDAPDRSGTSGISPDSSPAVADSAPRPDSIGVRFRDSVKSLEALLAEGRLDEADAQIARLDRTVYGYGFAEFSTIEARIAAARNGVLAAPEGDVESLAQQERVAEQARAAEAAQLADEERLAGEARIVEQAKATRIAEQARLAEVARIAEQARVAEATRIAEQARVAERARIVEQARAAEATRIAEQARAAEATRIAEQARVAEAARANNAARLAESERLAAADRSKDSRQLADDIAQSEGAARIAEAERRADAAATNALVTAASASSPEEKADAQAAARAAARTAAQERAAEVERRRVARADAGGSDLSRPEANGLNEGVVGGTGAEQRAADRRATTRAADRAATDRRIAAQRDEARRLTGTGTDTGQQGAAATVASNSAPGRSTDVVSASPRTSAPEPERADTASVALSGTTAERPVIGDDDLRLVYGRFIELEKAIEQRNINSVISLTRPSGARIQQFLQVFENSESLEARITNVSMRKVDAEITGMLRIDTIRRSDGSRVRPPPGLEAVALSSKREDSGWSALVW